MQRARSCLRAAAPAFAFAFACAATAVASPEARATGSGSAEGATGPAHPPASARAGQEKAVALYKESSKAYEEGRFQEAVDLLLQAYALADEPVLLFNLARAYEGLGEAPKAIDAYKRYVARDPSSSDRGSIEQRIATLQKQEDERAALERQRDEERQRAEQAQRAATEAAARAEVVQEDRRSPSAVPWVVAGLGVLGVGAGVGLGLVSRSRYDSAKDDVYRGPAQADLSSAQSFATGANVAFLAGGIVAAIGIVWGALDLRSKRHTEGVGPGGIGGHF